MNPLVWYTFPTNRLAWDADGSVFFYDVVGSTSTPWTLFNPAETVWLTSLAVGNNESTDTLISVIVEITQRTEKAFVVLFPQPMDMYGWRPGIDTNWVASYLLHSGWSADTRNGIDGTWNAIPDISSADRGVHGLTIWWKMGINAWTGTNVVGVRSYLAQTFKGDSLGSLKYLHLYGSPSTAANPDRVLFVDASSGLALTVLKDWGLTPRGGTFQQTFKIKNNSSLYTANNVVITAESLTDDLNAGFTFSDGGSYVTSLNITSIAAGASSATITAKLVVGDLELSLRAARIKAAVGSWT